MVATAPRLPPPHRLREYQADDADYVIGHWISGAAKSLPAPMTRELRGLWSEAIAIRLAKGHSLVAVHPDDESIRMGFLCASELPHSRAAVVHWIYVWRSCRNEGLARAMMDAAVPAWRERTIIGTGLSAHAGWLAKKTGALLLPMVEA